MSELVTVTCVDCEERFTYRRSNSGGRLRKRCDECATETRRRQARDHKQVIRARLAMEESGLGPDAVRREGGFEAQLDDHYDEPCTCGRDYLTAPLGHRCEGSRS